MKYGLVKIGNQYVLKAITDEIDSGVDVYDSKLEALGAVKAQIQYDSLPIALCNRPLKALPNGKIEGYAIIFTSKDDPDLLKDFFTKSTDFFLEPEQKSFNIPWVVYHHGLDGTIKARRLASGGAKAVIDDVGIWVESQLNLRDKYEKAIHQMAIDGKLGFSTGSAPHLTAKKALDGGVSEITAWPIIELSLTPCPVESRTQAYASVKAYAEELDNFDPRDSVLKAVIPTAELLTLPDSAYLYIEPGGSLGANGITTPQRFRHFPIKGLDGEFDEAHVKAALAQIPKAVFVPDVVEMVMRKARAAGREIGIRTPATKSLGQSLTQFLVDHCEDKGFKQADVIKAIGISSLCSSEVVEKILSDEILPSGAQIKGIAATLGLEVDVLRDLAASTNDKIAVSVKGIFQDQLDKEGYKTWELWNALSKVVTRVASAAAAVPLAGQSNFNWEKLIDEAIAEYSVELSKAIKTQIEDYIDGDTEYSFYLRALVNPTEIDFVTAKSVDLADHLGLVMSAFDSGARRVRANHAASIKAGRPLSKKNHEVFKSHLDGMQAKLNDAYTHLNTMVEKPSPEAQRARTKALLAISESRLKLSEV